MMIRFQPWMEVVRWHLLECHNDSHGTRFVKTEPQEGDKIYVSRETPPSIRMWRKNDKAELFWGGMCRLQDHSEFCRKNRIDVEPLRIGGSSKKTFRFAGLHYLDFEWPKDLLLSDEGLAAHALAHLFPHLMLTLEKRKKDEDPIMSNGVVYIKEVEPKPAQ